MPGSSAAVQGEQGSHVQQVGGETSREDASHDAHDIGATDASDEDTNIVVQKHGQWKRPQQIR